jgi:hypothetical protein
MIGQRIGSNVDRLGIIRLIVIGNLCATVYVAGRPQVIIMRHLLPLLLLLSTPSTARTQDLDGMIAQVQTLLAPDMRVSLDGSGVLVTDHFVDGELRVRHRVNVMDLASEATDLDTTRNSIIFHCQGIRPRCITTVDYSMDLEKRSSRASVLVHGSEREMVAAKEAFIALVEHIAEKFGPNETSELRMRMTMIDHTPEP